jgi:parallel beta-helix repeat protein
MWPRWPHALIGIFALAMVVFALSTYFTPLARSASYFGSGNKYLALVEGLVNPFRNRSLLLKSGLPIYDLKIPRQQYAIIERAVQQARKQGWMDDELKVWANARFIHDGQEYNVKVRVRGDLPPHWQGPKKSWRIKFGKRQIEENGVVRKEPIYFQGRRMINLIIPGDRDYILAYFVNSLLREKGLVVPRDQFVILRINGVLQGLYYEVEHFDKPLLAAHRRPETTVFAQNDRAMHFEQYTKYGAPGASDAKFDIGTMRRLVDRQGPLAMQAMQVLIDHSTNPTPENFRRVRSVLDWEKYLRFRVLTTLCNTNHVRFGSDNLRLYFDPSRGLLEPIPWDLHLVRMPNEPGTIDFWNSHGPDEIQRATLTNPELRLQRNQILWELVADGGDDLIGKYEAIHERIRPLAWADVLSKPLHGHRMDLLRKDFEYNVRRVHKVLSLSGANFTYRLEAGDRAALEVIATNFSGLQLQWIQVSDPLVFEGKYRLYEDGNNNGRLDEDDPLLDEMTSRDGTLGFSFEKYVLPQVEYGSDILKVSSPSGSIDRRYWEYFDTLAGRIRFFLVGKLTPEKRHPLEWNPPQIQITAVNAVTSRRMPWALIDQTKPLPDHYIGITAYDASHVFDLEAPDRSLTEFLQSYPEFTASREQPGAAELNGRTTIAGTVIVPKSVPLILKPGTDITMMPAASLLSYGGLTAIGTPASPIRIHGDGKAEPWGVVAAVRPPQKVVMIYIDVQDGGQAQINGILFTGGLAVHEGDLHLEHCRFVDMRSEDGINLKRGHIVMRDCLVAGGASDGMDLDFTTGEVRDSVFINNKGDGVDLSGSRVMLVGNRFENTGDKGISVGEDSHPIIINNLIRGNQIGISTKDSSSARVAYSTFVDNGLAIEAKRKKPMFGPGRAEFVNNVFSGNKVLLQEDYFSRGQISQQSSLLDRAGPSCSTCQTTEIRFLSSERGDYRLAPAALEGHGFVPASASWAGDEFNGLRPQQPGIFAALPSLAPMRQ